MNKRGQSLSMNTIIITILVVIVLVVIALFFTGGMNSLTNKIKAFFGAQLTDLQEASARCNAYCTNYQTTESALLRDQIMQNFCYDEFQVDINGNGIYDENEKGLTCSSAGISCDVIQCSK